MINALSTAFAAIFYVGAMLGSSGIVTGWVLISAIAVAALTYVFCLGVDEAVAWVRRLLLDRRG